MSCVNMTDILARAKSDHYAVGAFNIVDYASFHSVVRAAEEHSAPVIVQTSVKTVLLWGYRAIAGWYRELGECSKVSVVLHLDHCKDIDVVNKCLDAGWTSVMIDASAKPFLENLEITRRVIELAHPAGATVEAELGEIGSVEEVVPAADADARLADPLKAEAFAKSLSLDLLAPAIGTAHGIYKGEPKIAFDRIGEISRRTGLPLALHGGTGLSAEVFRRCISLGCAKVNISTHLKHVFLDSLLEYRHTHPQEYEPLKDLAFQIERMKAQVGDFIRLFGSEGRATA